MRPRAMLCPKKTIETIGFNEIKQSGKYDIFRTIGKDTDVDLSKYSEIVLLYQYPLKETNNAFLDFVRKYQDDLKNATILFDIPLEIIEETGMKQSKECMRSICRDVFGDEITSISIHSPSKVDDAVCKFSEQMDMKIVINKGWEKESEHTALLTPYHFREISQPVMKICKFEIIIGLVLAVVGAIFAILETAGVISSGLIVLYAILIGLGAIAAITGFNGQLKDNWRK